MCALRRDGASRSLASEYIIFDTSDGRFSESKSPASLSKEASHGSGKWYVCALSMGSCLLANSDSEASSLALLALDCPRKIMHARVENIGSNVFARTRLDVAFVEGHMYTRRASGEQRLLFIVMCFTKRSPSLKTLRKVCPTPLRFPRLIDSTTQPGPVPSPQQRAP